ncbi:DNA-directed RNA polymerase subunit omega [Bogoriella caseilytica]|uniref:DNA-directed RNA polymerase subunit omega n=1 Tax=Bogoriella caseilytica TaxID=56055 RepID=A0A3N2B978_9MICO|nr:DNA-directed RNA polymerase subunit omega [Bogoriella caseilytica]ROR71692.1 DNA-directed RNA polymerase subunit omega [Bogoriella caseilytica]
MYGTVAAPEGITDPPIDDLLDKVDSKYALVIYASKRARQINTYNAQLQEGLLEFVGPLVPSAQEDKSLSISLREISEGMLTITSSEEHAAAQAQRFAAAEEQSAELPAELDPSAELDAPTEA